MPTSFSFAQSKQSDRDLSFQVKQSLRETRCAALQRIRYTVVDGIVELSGDVPSFYFKQIAQEVLLTLNHVQGIENRLRVRCST
jgi:osmotically-inducible protein OsmY